MARAAWTRHARYARAPRATWATFTTAAFRTTTIRTSCRSRRAKRSSSCRASSFSTTPRSTIPATPTSAFLKIWKEEFDAVSARVFRKPDPASARRLRLRPHRTGQDRRRLPDLRCKRHPGVYSPPAAKWPRGGRTRTRRPNLRTRGLPRSMHVSPEADGGRPLRSPSFRRCIRS